MLSLMDLRKERANLLLSRATSSSSGAKIVAVGEWKDVSSWPGDCVLEAEVSVSDSDGGISQDKVGLTFNGADSPCIVAVVSAHLPLDFELSQAAFGEANTHDSDAAEALGLQCFKDLMQEIDQLDPVALKPWPYAQAKEALVARALCALARSSSVELRRHELSRRFVDGSVMVSVLDPACPFGTHCGKYGERFAQALSVADWRCGEAWASTAVYKEGGWAYVRGIEKVVREYARAMQESESGSPVDRPRA